MPDEAESRADDWWRRPLRSLVCGRRVILAGGVAAGWTPTVPRLRELGATDALVVATEGCGAGPQPEATTVVAEPDPALGFMQRVRASIAMVGHPPAEIVDAISAFDPDRSAVVIGTFLNESPELAGRPMLAHRKPEWLALEDKLVVDALLDRAGIDRSPSTVVPLAEAGQTWRSHDRGCGSVWSIDATSGYHGGASGTRWVTSDDEAARVTDEFRSLGSRVRIMAFLEGVATSIHGIVLPAGIAVMRPVELVTLRRRHELVYSGCATFWDPPDAFRHEMRDAARRMGEQLRAEVGYRGAFTLDGVATADGFRPTELNPRYGAGLATLMRGSDVPLVLVMDLVVAGVPLDITAADLEHTLVNHADAHRAGGTWSVHGGTPEPIDNRVAAFDGEAWRWLDDGAEGDAVVVSSTRFCRASFVPERTPIGPSVGPRAAAFWTFLDSTAGSSIGPLRAPPDVAAD